MGWGRVVLLTSSSLRRVPGGLLRCLMATRSSQKRARSPSELLRASGEYLMPTPSPASTYMCVSLPDNETLIGTALQSFSFKVILFYLFVCPFRFFPIQSSSLREPQYGTWKSQIVFWLVEMKQPKVKGRSGHCVPCMNTGSPKSGSSPPTRGPLSSPNWWVLACHTYSERTYASGQKTWVNTRGETGHAVENT